MNTETWPSAKDVEVALEQKLTEMVKQGELPDVITFAGNGEPTLHPQFTQIIDSTIRIRNRYCSEAKIAVLSNASLIQHQPVFDALLKVDQNILKLDSVIPETIEILNQPLYKYNVNDVIENLKRFNGQCIIQTLFIKGKYKGTAIDNTSDKEVEGWLNALREIKPQEVMIYTIARDTPTENLEKVPLSVLNEIARKVNELGFKTQISG